MSDFDTLKQGLESAIGAKNVITDDQECRFYSQDIFKESDFTAKAVIRPGNKDELAKAVGIITSAGYAIFPRGGGMSYTGGYLPSCEKAISLDMARMDRVLEINEEDMYVTVEAGCTWAQLHDALKDKDVRTPFWGTLSGLKATIGGGVSQNSLFFGTGKYGASAESVIGLEVVAANGEIVKTGSRSVKGANGFSRYYGPDLTGVFLCDTGALGVKATVTLQLISRPKFKAFGSFSFDNYADMLPAMSEIARRGLASECFGFDPYLQQQRMKRESISKDVKNLAGVLKASDGIMDAVKKGTKLAVAGRGYMKDVLYSFHATSENKTKEMAEADMAEIREIALAAGGKELENSIPTLVSANPFLPLNNMVGPEGERWAPIHGITSHSKVVELHDEIEKIFNENAEGIEKFEIGVGYMYITVGPSSSTIEPVFFWKDELKALHKDSIEAGHLKSLKCFDENLEIRAFVNKVRMQLAEMFMDKSATHLQIGKTYKYKDGLEENSFNLTKAIKDHMDPKGLINPGSLGLK